MSCAFGIFRNYWFRCFLRWVMFILLQQKTFGPNVIYFVLKTKEQQQTKANKSKQQQTCKHNKKQTKFRFSLNFQNIIRRSPQASPTKNWKIKSAVKENIRDLSSSSKHFERDTYSQNEIYDIGTEILLLTKNDHNSTQKVPKSIILGRIKKSRTSPIIWQCQIKI